MNIAVILKQYPLDDTDTVYQDVGVLVDSDKNALTEALNLRDKYGGAVSALVLGPAEGKILLQHAYTMGIDAAYLITDDVFMNSDAAVASKIVAKALKHAGGFDLILFGRQAIDGDGAHVAALTASKMGLAQVIYSKSIEAEGENIISVKHTEYGDYTYKLKKPCVIMTQNDKSGVRHSKISDIMIAYTDAVKVDVITNAELGIGLDELGEKGSCLVELGREHPEVTQAQTIWIEGSTKEQAKKLKDLFSKII